MRDSICNQKFNVQQKNLTLKRCNLYSIRIQYQQLKSDPNHWCKQVSNSYSVQFPNKSKIRYPKILLSQRWQTEKVAEDVTEISSFLLIVLKEGNDLLQQNSTNDEFKDKVTTYLELLEVMTKMLETCYVVFVDEDDQFCWENLASQYCSIFIVLLNQYCSIFIAQSFCGESDKETVGLPGRPKYNIPAKTLGELCEVDFS